MGGVNRKPLLPPIRPSDHVTVLPFGEATTFLLENRGRVRPTAIAFLHAPCWPDERGEPDDGPITTCVWLRAVWPDKTETLGFVSVSDAAVIATRFPKVAKWLSQLVRVFVPQRKRSMTELERLDERQPSPRRLN